MFLKDFIFVLTSSLLLLPRMLEEGAKLTDEDNGIGRWIKKQLHNTASPLFHWNKGEIRDAIDRLKRTGEQASSSTEYPLCLLDVPEWLHFILRPVIPVLLSASLILIGENSVGKTSLAMILAFAFSRWHIRCQKLNCLPAVRVTQDIDFLKSKTGCPEEPIVYDDGDIWGLKPTQLKALLDVQAQSPMVRARYTAAKFTAGQLRIVCDNAYDKAAAEDLKPGSIDQNTLWQIVSPAFHPEVRGAHVGAILKRACFVVNTTKFLIVKLAGKPEVMVYPLPVGSSYIPDNGSEMLSAFFKDGEPRPGLNELLVREAELMKQYILDTPQTKLPSLNAVSPPPDFNEMTWHQVRTLIETGYEAGLRDPYPRNYPKHLRWVSQEEQARIDADRADRALPIKNLRDEEPEDNIWSKMVKSEASDSENSLPDSDDSFWAPVTGRDHEEHHGTVGMAGASSSTRPPAFLMKDEVKDEDQFNDADGVADLDPFHFPPAQSQVDALMLEPLSPEDDNMDDLPQEAEPFSQPPIPEEFLGVDHFVPDEYNSQDELDFDADTEMEKELLSALMDGDHESSD